MSIHRMVHSAWSGICGPMQIKGGTVFESVLQLFEYLNKTNTAYLFRLHHIVSSSVTVITTHWCRYYPFISLL